MLVLLDGWWVVSSLPGWGHHAWMHDRVHGRLSAPVIDSSPHTLPPTSIHPPIHPPTHTHTCTQVLPDSVATGLSPAQNIGVVAAQLGGMELIKLTALHLAHRLNWL